MLSAGVVASRGALSKIGDELTADYQNRTTGTVEVEAYAGDGKGQHLAGVLTRLTTGKVQRHGRAVDAVIPVSNLAKLAAVKGLRFTRPVSSATAAGLVTSQGDVAIATAAARATYGVTGAGVKVGIVSDSFNAAAGLADTYATDVTNHDLPAGVQILAEGPTTGTDEGRAIAQVIYDEAPGVTFAFATATGSQATMAANINNLVKAGAKIIVDDFKYLNEPFFQDGPVAQAVQAAVAAGVTYFSAAGNYGQNAYAGTWQNGVTRAAGAIPSAAGAPAFYGGTSFNFSATDAVNDMNAFTLAPGQSIHLSMQWDSPYFSVSHGAGSQNQVDAYVLNADGSQIVGGGVNLDLGGDPIQLFTFTNAGTTAATYNLMLVSESGATPGYVKYIDFAGQAGNWAFAPNSGTIFGHSNAVGAEAVGAAYYGNTPAFGVSPPQLEPTSSTGTTPIFFDTAGNRLTTAVTRQQPGLVAADGVSTTFFGQTTGTNPYPSFFGTSAAVAGAAGAAALLLQKVPAFTPAQINAILQNTALTIGSPVPNSSGGYGLIQANQAVASVVGNISGAVFQDNNGNATLDPGETGVAGVLVYVDAGNTGAFVAGDINTSTASDGTYVLSNVPAGSAVVRFVTPGGFVAVSGSRTVTAGASVTGITFGVFPDAFSGAAGNYNYTVQADPTTNTKLNILVGNVLTYTVARSLLPALTFTLGGTNNSLTVNFANGTPIPTGGLTFANIGPAVGNNVTVNGTAGNDTASINSQTTVFNSSSIFTSNIQSETLNGNNGNDSFTVINAQPSGQGLTFNGGTGNTSLLVRSTLPNNGIGTVFNAGTAVTDQNTLTVNTGTWTFAGDPALTSANLTVNANATVVFAAGAAGTGINARRLAALNIGAAGVTKLTASPTQADRQVLVANTLAITTGGKLDLSSNDMIISSGNAGAISTALSSGFAGGLWNGAGIQSTAAAGDSTHLTAIGELLNNSTGTPVYGTGTALGQFDGTNPAPAAVLLKYTYYGDANLSGSVDGSDYTQIDAAFATPKTGWYNGDFNYDGKIDGSDYTLIDNAFNTQGIGL